MSDNIDSIALHQVWKDALEDLVSSMEATPVIYNDAGVPIWAGKPITGKLCIEECEKITKAKLQEYQERGEVALLDSEPLENVLKAGEFRIE